MLSIVPGIQFQCQNQRKKWNDKSSAACLTKHKRVLVHLFWFESIANIVQWYGDLSWTSIWRRLHVFVSPFVGDLQKISKQTTGFHPVRSFKSLFSYRAQCFYCVSAQFKWKAFLDCPYWITLSLANLFLYIIDVPLRCTT